MTCHRFSYGLLELQVILESQVKSDRDQSRPSKSGDRLSHSKELLLRLETW